MSFRPLARYIGLYQTIADLIAEGIVSKFPSPREVNRFISAAPTSVVKEGDTMFPSPLEVDWFISKVTISAPTFSDMFPSPLEVDRFISFWGLTMENFIISYRPLSR